ncbi:M15 family metallopeptidase [Actinomarinicola tropica]|uniref:Peptidase M15C domain-containing protein n=1 Tax=Actinomarinicola tropica TaxID=2789776 RepID=A0A5Q2RIQ4_9ACTN|nr:M15 family metallopeptidase [Actinomarinicola tropica]QGG94266.1 hypothetical protein GH723_03645 [Actinomarinicola tropica]
MGRRRLAGIVVGLLVALVASGAVVARGSDDGASPSSPADAETTTTTSAPPTSTTGAPPTTTTTVVDESTILLVWTSGGLPPGFADAAAARPEVERTTVVRGGQADLTASAQADGTAVDAAPPGWAYPLDTVAVAPGTYAGFVNDPVDRELIDGLDVGEGLLTASSAELRGVDVGGTLALEGGTVTVVGIVGDRSGAEAELVVHVDDADRFGVGVERFLLAVHDPTQRPTLDAALTELAGTNPVNIRTTADTTRLRHGDSVVPTVQIKLAFGEFAYRDLSGRQVEIDPAWVAENIVTEQVPILGPVRCHRAMIEPLTSALGQLQAEGLAHTVDPATYSGCWNARRMLPGAPLSKHAWGLAVDVNVDGDPRGDFATQHPRFTELMVEAGFEWGGDWRYPDPAHYELDP